MAFAFKKAQRSLSKLRLAIQGPSGSGKTYGALQLAKGLGGRIAVIDTERGSASLYSDIEGMPEFDVLDLDAPFTPERYIEAITAAEQAVYDILIIDSMTHEWSGVGGCLEINDALARSRYKGNSWAAWNEVTPRHRKFVDKMLTSTCHIIATMRSKTDTVQNERNGRKVVEKVGIKTEQRDGMDYEFTIVFDVTPTDHIATTSKDRTALFNDPMILNVEVGQKIASWLSSVKPAPIPVAAIAPAPVEPAPVQDDTPFEISVRIDELHDAMTEAQDMAQLNACAKQISGLGLPANHQGIQRLRQVYASVRARIQGA